MFRSLPKMLWSAAFLAAATLGMGGAANATLVVGRFDPSFGVALPGVNFSGTANFNIAQSCLNLSLPSDGPSTHGAFIFSGFNCGGGGSGMDFLGAHVDFTDNSNNPIGHVDFSAASGVILGM